MAESLRKSGQKGMFWSFMIQGGTQIINFGVTVLLARLLMPAEFGLIGMISIFIAISRALVDGGFVSSLIRTRDADNSDYSTVFFVNLLSSLLLYLVLFLAAPFIADFYSQDILVNLVRVLGLVLIINAFSMVQSTKLNKELQFKTQFLLQLPSLLISALVSVWMAYNDFGVWSLVAKDLIYALLATLQLWWYSKWVPDFVFNKEKFRRHFNFGYKLSLTQIINTAFDNLYYVIIGKYFSAAQLGYFTRARSLEQLPTSFFFNSFNRVFYPLLAKVNDDLQLKRVYSQLMSLVVFIVTPLLVFLGVVAEPFIRWLLTDKWLPAVPFFQLLLISGIFFPIQKYNLNICNLKGRSDLVLKLSVLQNILLVTGALSALWFGIYGLLYSLVATSLVVTLVNISISGKLIKYGLSEQLKDIFPTLLLNIGLAAILYYFQVKLFSTFPDFINLLLSAATFFMLYFLSAYVLRMEVMKFLKSYIKK